MAAQSGNDSANPPRQGLNAAAHGVYKVGGDVSAPVLIHSVQPKLSEKARNAKVDGSALVNLYVDVNGNPSHIRVIRGVGLDLDESAVEAVRRYKFKPAMKDGKPVMVEMNIEVNFQAN